MSNNKCFDRRQNVLQRDRDALSVLFKASGVGDYHLSVCAKTSPIKMVGIKLIEKLNYANLYPINKCLMPRSYGTSTD